MDIRAHVVCPLSAAVCLCSQAGFSRTAHQDQVPDSGLQVPLQRPNADADTTGQLPHRPARALLPAHLQQTHLSQSRWRYRSSFALSVCVTVTLGLVTKWDGSVWLHRSSQCGGVWLIRTTFMSNPLCLDTCDWTGTGNMGWAIQLKMYPSMFIFLICLCFWGGFFCPSFGDNSYNK